MVITSPDNQLLKILKEKYKNKIITINRPKKFGFLNTELETTIKHTLKKIRKKNIKFDYVMQISFRTPFITPQVIDDGINTLQLFNSDKVICVTQENHQYYKHDGSGLKRLVRSSNLKLERDTIYKQVMGFNITKKNSLFIRDEDLKIGHIVLSNKQSVEVNTEEDLKISNKIYFKE